MQVKLCKYDETFLVKSYEWLNDPYIKRTTDTPDVSRELQKEWYDSLLQKTDYIIWGVEFDGKPIGACGLKHKKSDSAEYWGYIGEKGLHGKGLGYSMLTSVIDEAKRMKLTSVHLSVLIDNQIAINLYNKCGFYEKCRDTKYIYMQKDICSSSSTLTEILGGGNNLTINILSEEEILWAA